MVTAVTPAFSRPRHVVTTALLERMTTVTFASWSKVMRVRNDFPVLGSETGTVARRPESAGHRSPCGHDDTIRHAGALAGPFGQVSLI